ncbi:MAG: helix-turn-helix domain-containing protein [Mycobacterium sp.]
MDNSDKGWEMLGASRIADGPPARVGFLVTIPEAAAALRISRSSIYRLFDTGQLRSVRISGSRRVSTAEINWFIAAHTEVA